jgi:hypothetical protein
MAEHWVKPQRGKDRTTATEHRECGSKEATNIKDDRQEQRGRHRTGGSPFHFSQTYTILRGGNCFDGDTVLTWGGCTPQKNDK